MLGGGNPARIPEVEAVYRRRLTEIAADAAQFGRFAGQYSDPAGDPAFRDAVAGALAAEFGWRLERRNVALTAGSQIAFFFLFNWLAGPRPTARAGVCCCRSRPSTSATPISAWRTDAVVAAGA